VNKFSFKICLLYLVAFLFLFPGISFSSSEGHSKRLDGFAQETSVASVSKHLASDEGILLISVETIRQQTPKCRSIMAQMVEILRGDKPLARMKRGDKGVESSFHRQIYRFPPIILKAGYHFITVRVYSEGFISHEMKWKGRIIQVGIHPGRTTTVNKLFPFFVW